MIQNLITSLLISSAIGLGSNNVKYTNTFEKPHEILNVSYNDNTQIIILNADELNNYVFVNLNNLFDELYSDGYRTIFSNSFILYNSANLLFEEIVEEYIFYAGDNYSIEFAYGYDNVNDGRFSILYNQDVISFEYDLEWQLPSLEIYTQIKNAIELDIDANNPPTMGEQITDVIASGLGLIGDIAQEFLNGFINLFTETNDGNTTLSTFAIFAFVMLGISITMAVVSLVLNLIRGNSGV